ncbi:MAG: 16S rRNA (cytidine(1402)-2'-O)-methyltransferase [Nitrospirota bacterium]|nr:MAG: 16S rRNA (cytidine(1402)-2'-O)-methyltransferase [Nitrospirota bacterium]
MMAGLLYIVSTPIGNLEDITLRALKVLGDVDVIAAEDTRHSRKLLSHYNISKELVSYWSGREKARSEKILDLLDRGKDVALISDAGTPGISDPGEILIRSAIERRIEVIPVPGPSALISALTISGIPTASFVFAGFAPPKKQERKRFYESLASERRTIILYESPHRLVESLEDLAGSMPSRDIALCHELTKMNESVFRGKAEDVLMDVRSSKIAGEYVIVMKGAEKKEISFDEALDEIRELMRTGKGRKEAVGMVAKDYGISKKKLYDMSLE